MPELQSTTPDAVAEQIRKLAEQVDTPSNWMVTIPVELFDDVKAILDTEDDLGTEYNGISLCWKNNIQHVQVKYKNTLSDHLENTGYSPGDPDE